MIPYVGDFAEDATVYHYFNTFSSDDPAASVTITNLVDADLKVHKDGGTTEATTDGATISIDFDTVTGTHLVTIDSSADAFYATGSDYMVRMEGTTVDGGTINAALFTFSIENRYSSGALRPTTAGRTLDVSATGEAGLDFSNTNLPDGPIPELGIMDRGTGQAATATTFTVRAAATDDTLEPGMILWAFGSTQGYWQQAVIDSVSGDIITIDSWPNATPSGTLTYQVIGVPQGSPNLLPDVNVAQLSGDATAADNAESFFDGTGYAGTNNVIPTVTTLTGHTAQTGDSFARIGVAGAGLTNINLPNQAMNITGNITGNLSGSVGSVTGAVGSVTGNVGGIAGTITTLDALDTAQDTQHSTTQGLIGTPTDLGGGATLSDNNSDIAGATFSSATDSNEALRNRGDAEWTTGAGGTPPQLLQSTTIATLASQTSFTLTAGSADNDAYNGAVAVITDQSTSTQKAVASISDYVGSTLTVTLAADPAIFTMAVGDTIEIIAALGATAADIRAEIDSNSTQLAAIVADTNELQSDDIPGLIATAQADLDIITGVDGVNLLSATQASIDAIEADTNEVQGDLTNGGRLDLILDELTTQGDTNETKIDTIDGIVDSILVDTGTTIPDLINDGAIQRNTAGQIFHFDMVLASDHVTPATGLTVTAQRLIDSGTYTAVTGSIVEVSNGTYRFNPSQADTNGTIITWRFSEGTADDTKVTFKTTP